MISKQIEIVLVVAEDRIMHVVRMQQPWLAGCRGICSYTTFAAGAVWQCYSMCLR